MPVTNIWGAILIEEKEGKIYIYGYKSGRFSNAEMHYHSTFKEVLAVKKSISKFDFHLIGYHFLIEMDMSSFPKILMFKQKDGPHPQLLRWSEWFFKYSFDVKHIRGKINVLANFLTKPPEKILVIAHSSSSSQTKKAILSNPPLPFSTQYVPPNSHPEHSLEVLSLILEKRFHKEALNMMFSHQLDVFKNCGGLYLKPLGLHLEYPFIHPIKLQFTEFPDELKWMLWYLTHLYHIGIQFDILDLQYFLTVAYQGRENPELHNWATFLKWFYLLNQWLDMITLTLEQPKRTPHSSVVIIFYEPQYFMQHGASTQLGAFPTAWIHKTYSSEVDTNPYN